MPPPDVVILAAEWKTRALLRAQLIEEGFEVAATDSWPMMRRYLRPGEKPRAAIVDLHDLAEPDRVLEDLRLLMPPARVLVIGALATVAGPDVTRRGFRYVPRPLVVSDIVRAVVDMIGPPTT